MKITVLTDSFALKRKKTLLKSQVVFDGHKAVTRSLIEGLKLSGIRYSYNPTRIFRKQKNVIVLSGNETLKKALELKKEDRIKKLLVGPNMFVFPSENNGILGDDMIDGLIVPSDWVRDLYVKDLPKIKDKIFVWPAGVNQTFWSPSNTAKNNVLLYIKTDNDIVIDVQSLLEKNRIKYTKLVYGKYDSADYKKQLDSSRAAIFLSTSESQGLALVEAWSMNVPTLVWNAKKTKIISIERSLVTTAASSAPYLSTKTGVFWDDIKELEAVVKDVLQGENSFEPRNWVLNNMTDLACAVKLTEIFNDL